MINDGAVPWLIRSRYRANLPMVKIMAGASIEEFKDLVAQAGGKVYEAVEEA
jgi:hypothetical protein